MTGDGGAGDVLRGGPDDDGAARQAARRAARLLRWYPRAWRDRYGEEFTELLIADMAERPRSPARFIDIVRNGIMARLGRAGLARLPLPAVAEGPADADDARRRQVSASLGSLGCALAVCWVFGAALWSQLMTGSQWTPAFGTGTQPVPLLPVLGAGSQVAAEVAAYVMSGAMLVLLALGFLAAFPVAAAVAARLTRPARSAVSRARLALPAVVVLAAAACLFIGFFGGRNLGNGWPGTGGHGGFAPTGVQAFESATSLSVSAYWAHPEVLAAFPATELAWMAVSPFVLAIAIVSMAVVVRRAGLSRRALAFEARLATAACAAMAVFLAGAVCWEVTGGQQPLFRVGLIDIVATAVIALALAVAVRARLKAGHGSRRAGMS